MIAYRIGGPNGIFLGIIARRIEPANFEKFFASVALGDDAAIAMFHRDGTMLARHPHTDTMIGQNFRSAPLLARILDDGDHQTLRVESPIDHQDKLGAAAELNHFPIVVVATTTVSAALVDWREQTQFLIIAATLATLVIALILFLIVRQLTRQNREAQLRLESEKQRLDTALNNMTQGLVLYDASARIVICNQRYLDMYRLSTDVVKPGCRFVDLIRHRKDTGSFEGDVDEFCSTVMRNVADGKVTRSILKAADGRAVLIVNKPLAQGGWVATIEDITERQKLEQERDRNYCFPAPDHRSHPLPDHRERRERPSLRAGQSGGRDAIRVVARRHYRQDRGRAVLKAGGRTNRRRRRPIAAICRRPARWTSTSGKARAWAGA